MKPTILCQFEKFSCFGCCGNRYGSKNSVFRQIKKNTYELSKIKDLKKFRDREDANILSYSGICFNLIMKDGRVFCPLHPLQTGGKDLRDGHCDIDHLCRTAETFAHWSEEKQTRFLTFLREKNHNFLTYSFKMDNHEYLKEFVKLESEKKIKKNNFI